jgi:hypothetical protein
MFPPREIEIPFATPDAFCETLVRIERIGSCTAADLRCCRQQLPGPPHVGRRGQAADLMAELTQAIVADDRSENGGPVVRLPINAVAH